MKPNKRGEVSVLTKLGNFNRYSGKTSLAITSYEESIAIDKDAGHEEAAVANYCNLGSVLVRCGQFSAAHENLRRSIALSRESGDDFHYAVAHQELGRLLAYEGAFARADEALDVAMFFVRELDGVQSECVVWQYKALRQLLARNPGYAMSDVRRAQALAGRIRTNGHVMTRDHIQMGWLLSWALVGLAEADAQRKDEYLTAAETALAEALSNCRRMSLVGLEPGLVLSLARLILAEGEPEAASEQAEDALAVAKDCEYRLDEADIHLFLARVALEVGDLAAARKHAETARQRALCDGPRRCYRPVFNEAKTALGSAVAPRPVAEIDHPLDNSQPVISTAGVDVSVASLARS